MPSPDKQNAGEHRCNHWTPCNDDAETVLSWKGCFRQARYCETHAKEMLDRDRVVKGRWWSE